VVDQLEHLRSQIGALLGRPVDLVVLRAVRNPYFLKGS